MGCLSVGESKVTLPARAVIGRAPTSTIRISDGRVSGEHARIAWTRDGWVVRDLGSRNGTFLDGTRIPAGEDTPAPLGSAIGVGSSDPSLTLHLVDAGPPIGVARDVVSGATVEGTPTALALPSEDAAELTLFATAKGWLVDENPERILGDGDRVSVGGRTFELMLPSAPVETTDTGADRSLTRREVHFQVSRDEEHVDIQLDPEAAHQIEPRAHHYVLAVLARLRLQDRARGLPLAEEGWVHVEDLASMLRLEPGRINVDVYRSRRQFLDLGFHDAVDLVQRRRNARQLRLGLANIRVSTL
ncbi:MAG: FHA domain-containing protein [Polyangiaceae bacterium]